MENDVNRRSSKCEDVVHRSSFCVGAVSVQVVGECSDDVALVPSLLPFSVETDTSEINIRVEWTPTLERTSGRRLFDSDSTWRLCECDGGFQFDFATPVFGERIYKRLLVDDRFTEAALQMSEECFADFPLPGASLEYPVDELLIMHRLTQEPAIELHGTGIVRANGEGNLFVGHSGAGKSTTTRLWTDREDVEVLSDDRIIVRPDEVWRHAADELETPMRAAGALDNIGILRLRDCSAKRSNHFAQDDRVKSRGMRMYGTPWHGEAMFASPNSAPLQRVFVLEHGHGNVITRLSPSQAVAELFARAFVPFHRHEYVESALSFLERLADSVPCYRYSFEPDQRAVDKILHFHD
ncbi:MAG: hypothetical protein WAN65_15675 [Candidatus Sulfotelmatobacter sp.]